jgi:hypothetical protein
LHGSLSKSYITKKGKMKTTYKKVHTNPKAAAAHIAKITKRGGKVEKILSKGKIIVVSTYNSAKPKHGQKSLKL